ncbi:hypothetical protein ER308_01085 [Egibacter rhizosphaerae]|uniref:YjbQ family protein n=1 Tax=Egibacter rhizosphaerae TaxID=1670831 RepID=A0A411YAR9_9ACTN|nr:YjbQ family protein [Egibacter rhizosphaerae]QBI18301.1 hypothetical protein ER308_01085 [Egibacter rhizosphaerae]
MESTVLEVTTGSSRGVHDLTDEVAGWCAGRGDGLLHVFAPHATCGLALVETGAGSEHDLLSAVDELLPRDEGRWQHRHGPPGHGADHVLPALVAPFLVLPVDAGEPALGTWQRVCLVDPNADNPRRRVRVSFLAG